MLQARMYSEAEVAQLQESNFHQHSLKQMYESLESVPEDNGVDAGHGLLRSPQFLDESHVFWCSSCNGDLIVL